MTPSARITPPGWTTLVGVSRAVGVAAFLRAFCASEASIERVPYDAEAVAREVEAVGLPGEFAEQPVIAA